MRDNQKGSSKVTKRTKTFKSEETGGNKHPESQRHGKKAVQIKEAPTLGKSREPPTLKRGQGRLRSKEKKSSGEATKPSKEIVEKDSKVTEATRALCNYVLNIKESSLNAYFDTHLAKYSPSNETTTAWEKNKAKNRSKTHKMYDSSRVKLEERSNDYINASLLKFDNFDTEFILTQYPLPETIIDFWTMVFQKQVDRVISIYEPGSDEAIEEYAKTPDTTKTPTSKSESPPKQFLSATKSVTQKIIEGVSSRCDIAQTKSLHPMFANQYMNINGWLINTRKIDTEGHNKHYPPVYTVEVLPEGCSNAIFVRVFNSTNWPWKQTPSDEKKLLALVRAPWKDLIPKVGKPEPIVVVCDLGLDRSACTVLTTVLIEMCMAGKTPDCEGIFRKMRDQRAGCFTMSIYYTYAIRAALFYLRIKLTKEIGDELKVKIEEAMAKIPFIKK